MDMNLTVIIGATNHPSIVIVSWEFKRLPATEWAAFNLSGTHTV